MLLEQKIQVLNSKSYINLNLVRYRTVPTETIDFNLVYHVLKGKANVLFRNTIYWRHNKYRPRAR